jgi:hypothetical protein
MTTCIFTQFRAAGQMQDGIWYQVISQKDRLQIIKEVFGMMSNTGFRLCSWTARSTWKSRKERGWKKNSELGESRRKEDLLTENDEEELAEDDEIQRVTAFPKSGG